MTYTYATMAVSDHAYDEIAAKLREAGYEHAINDDDELDMHGIALVREASEPKRDVDEQP